MTHLICDAALVFDDGHRCEGEARLVRTVGDQKYWTGTFRCVSALFLGDFTETLTLEVERKNWRISMINSSLTGFSAIETDGEPIVPHSEGSNVPV